MENNNKFFKPYLRFNEFNDRWDFQSIKYFSKFRRGSFPQPYGLKEWYGGLDAKPFVQVVDVSTNLNLIYKTKQTISILAQPKSILVKKGSVIVTLQGSIGRVAIMQYEAYIDRTILVFENFVKPINNYFWAYTIQNKFEIEKVKK